MRLKMDLRKLEDKITTVVNKSKSKYCEEQGYGIIFGLDILNEYLKIVADRALQIDDPIIIYNLMQIGVICPDNDEEESLIKERAEELESKINKK